MNSFRIKFSILYSKIAVDPWAHSICIYAAFRKYYLGILRLCMYLTFVDTFLRTIFCKMPQQFLTRFEEAKMITHYVQNKQVLQLVCTETVHLYDSITAIFSNIPKLKYRLPSLQTNKKGVDDHKFDVDSRLEHPSITMTRNLETSSTIFKNM